METEVREQELDLFSLCACLFQDLRRRWLPVLGILVLCGLLSLGIAALTHQPEYRCHVTVSVCVGDSGAYYSDAPGVLLAEITPDLLDTPMMTSALCRTMGWKTNQGTLAAEPIGNTNLLTLSASASTPQEALQLLTAAVAVYPEIACRVVDGASMTAEETPVIPESPVNPFDGLSAFARGMVWCGIFLVFAGLYAAAKKEIITTPEQLKVLTKYPILGEPGQTDPETAYHITAQKLESMLAQWDGETIVLTAGTNPEMTGAAAQLGQALTRLGSRGSVIPCPACENMEQALPVLEKADLIVYLVDSGVGTVSRVLQDISVLEQCGFPIAGFLFRHHTTIPKA